MHRFRTLLSLNILAHMSPKTKDIEINHRIQIAYGKFATMTLREKCPNTGTQENTDQT